VGCSVCDTPELWRGAAGLCARARACAGAAESLYTYIHIYMYKYVIFFYYRDRKFPIGVCARVPFVLYYNPSVNKPSVNRICSARLLGHMAGATALAALCAAARECQLAAPSGLTPNYSKKRSHTP